VGSDSREVKAGSQDRGPPVHLGFGRHSRVGPGNVARL